MANAATSEPLAAGGYSKVSLTTEETTGQTPLRQRLSCRQRSALVIAGAVSIAAGCAGAYLAMSHHHSPAHSVSGSLVLAEELCSEDGADCRKSQCCKTEGSKCFQKNDGWASCKASCKPGVDASDKDGLPWSCKVLAKSTPGETTLVTPPKAGGSCSWEGANCKETGCCRRQGFKCFQRDENYGSCSPDCGSLEKITGSKWACNVLGGSQPLKWAQPSKKNAAGTSLFCFTVITVGGLVAPGVHQGYEEDLLGMMKYNKVSLYACDGFKEYQGAKAQSGDWKSVVNTDIFLSVWNQVKTDGLYKQHDWTVKVDADAMFIPDRLKAHLTSLAPPADSPVYLHNIDFRFHFMGALEVLSTKAVELFIDNAPECQKHLGSNGGEDFFTMQCLDAVGAAHMSDFSLLDDKYTHDAGWNLNDVNSCTNQAIVAFHPYKSANSWLGCYKVAMGIQNPSDFVGCDHRWNGDACNLGGTLEHTPIDPQPSDGIIKNRH